MRKDGNSFQAVFPGRAKRFFDAIIISANKKALILIVPPFSDNNISLFFFNVNGRKGVEAKGEKEM
jgi:hypothetical protein